MKKAVVNIRSLNGLFLSGLVVSTASFQDDLVVTIFGSPHPPSLVPEVDAPSDVLASATNRQG